MVQEMAGPEDEEGKEGRLILQVIIHGTDELKAQVWLYFRWRSCYLWQQCSHECQLR